MVCGRGREKENREGGPGRRSCKHHCAAQSLGSSVQASTPACCLLPLLSFLLPNLYFLNYKIIPYCTSLKAEGGHPSFCPIPPTVVLIFQHKNRLGEGSSPPGRELVPPVRSAEALGLKQSAQ